MLYCGFFMKPNALARMAMESFLRKRFCFSCCRNATSGSAFGNFSKTNRFGENLECTAGIASEATNQQEIFNNQEASTTLGKTT